MTKKKLDLSKIEYKIKRTNTWEKIGGKPSFGKNFHIGGYDFITVTFRDKKGHKLSHTGLNGDLIIYDAYGAKKICIEINVESLMREKILEEKEGIYGLLINIIMANKIPYSVSIPQYEITSFDDDERKYISLSAHEIMLQSLNYALGPDLDLQIKLEFDLSITFENIEEAQNIEVREQALRKFGYENYVKEGFEKGKIDKIVYSNGEGIVFPTNLVGEGYNYSISIGNNAQTYPPVSYFTQELDMAQHKRKDEERIIILSDDIAFLQVKDSSTNKAYFLKVPPNIHSVEEAKAWTFGLREGEYNPTVET